MQCFAQAIDLSDDPEMIRVYKAHHRQVWPEVVRALRAAGITRMRIFLAGTRLFMYFEAPEGFDPARDYQAYAADPRCQEWDLLMRTFQRQLAGATPGAPDAWWTPMEMIFDLESGGEAGACAPVA